MMKIDKVMEYASQLADLEYAHEFEDIFKLATLCEKVATLKSENILANPEVEEKFKQRVKEFYENRGDFRSEIERAPLAKKLIENM